MKRYFVVAMLLLPLVCAVVLSSAEEGGRPGEEYPTFTEDGAWCWFQDPRSVYVEGQYKRTFAQWMTGDGVLQAGFYDHETGETGVHTLKSNWGVDDHNVGSFLVLPDKRLMCFYARHGQTGLYCRTSRLPESIDSWEEEVTIFGNKGVTYNHPVYLSEEDRIYVFWRGLEMRPTFSSSSDGKTWTEARMLIREKSRKERVRPYVKVASDGISSIHFAFTNGHPNREPTNSIYYLRYEKGGFFKADGTSVGTIDCLPIQHSESDLVYDATEGNALAWVWDIALDEDKPVIVYSRIPEETDHRYHYARWDGEAWRDTELCAAGKWFPQTQEGKRETEPFYSGGICLNHENPSIVYLSRQVKGVFEIERWETSDSGKTWTSSPVTRNSKNLNVRPVVPRGFKGEQVLWMNGTYVGFKDYQTAIRKHH